MNPRLDHKIVCAKLCRFVEAELLADATGFGDQSRLSDFGLDSFSLVELLLFCERTFGVAVPESQLTHENLESIAALGRCLCALPAPEPMQSQPE